MTERKLSELQKEYRNFFLGKLRLYGVKSPAELTKEKKSEFFTCIRQDWAKIKLKKNSIRHIIVESNEITDEDVSKYDDFREEQYKKRLEEIPSIIKKTQLVDNKKTRIHKEQQIHSRKHIESNINESVIDELIDNNIKQVVKSRPNEEQTDTLKILYKPNDYFKQAREYHYPVVKMPISNSSLKLPRMGRTNQKGYKEDDFYDAIKNQIEGIELTNDVHMVIPNYNKPYEPDIVLYDKTLNLYIDIEIDEPYDGYFRYPTHCIKFEEDYKQDDIRDLFFTESGWIVMRFTEKQVHLQVDECIDFIKNVLNSIYDRNFHNDVFCDVEEQWNENQCIQWQKEHYREKYLGINRFYKRSNYKEIEINVEVDESIEKIIQRTKKFNFENWSNNIAFDEESHKYLHPSDETGNAEYISVTTLIERFFPFDLKRYIEKKAKDENRDEEEVLDDFLTLRDEASEKGTYLHKQIENYLKGDNFDSETKEFQMFLSFYENEVKKRDLTFFDAEKMIVSEKYAVAGTIDCLFKKNGKDEYVILDWKRSKKLIIDGRPRIFGFGYALSELNTLDNSSYYRYCLQQNIYKYIIEREYHMKISSMQLVVLHENYPRYYVIKVPDMLKETTMILNSLNYKI